MQNTACSININGRADNAPPGHDRQQQDGSLRLGGCWALRDTQNNSIRGANPHSREYLSRESSTDLGRR